MKGIGILLGCFLLWASSEGESEWSSVQHFQGVKNQFSSDAVTDEEYAVYSALLATPRIVNGKRALRLVIGTDTAKPTIEEVRNADICHEDFRAGQSANRRGPSLLAGDVRSLVDDLLIRNRQTYAFDRNFSFPRPYTLLRNADFSRFFKERSIGGWDLFYGKFPDAEGFKTLSRVGFNREKTQALVYVVSAYTTIDTFTTFVLLRKQEDKWIRVEHYTCNAGRAGLKPEVP